MSTRSALTPLEDEQLVQDVTQCHERLSAAAAALREKQQVLDSLLSNAPKKRAKSVKAAYQAAKAKHKKAEGALSAAETALVICQATAGELGELQNVAAQHEQQATDEAEAKHAQEAADVQRKADKAEAKRKEAKVEAADVQRKADEAEAKHKEAKAEARRVREVADTQHMADTAVAKHKEAEAEAIRAQEAANTHRKADEAEVEATRSQEAADTQCKADEAEAKHKETEAEARHVREVADTQRTADAAEAKHKEGEAEARCVQAEGADVQHKADEAEARKKAVEADGTEEGNHNKGAVVKHGSGVSSAAGRKGKTSISRKPLPQKPSKTSDEAGKGDRERQRGKQTLTDIDTEGSDDSGNLGDKHKQKKSRQIIQEQITHWEDLLENTIYRIDNDVGLTQEALEALGQTRKKAEKNLEDVRAELEDSTYYMSVEGGEESGDGMNDGKTDDSKKRNIEEKWDLSFSSDAETMTNYFPDGPEAWRKMIQDDAAAHIQKFLDPTRLRKHRIPSDTRRLLRKIPALVSQCATSSKELALHVLTTKDGKTQCRFHDKKRSMQLAKQVDGPIGGKKFIIIGVAYTKVDGKRIQKQAGFLHCGCAEKEALWEFLWFKTWSAFSAGTLLDINDFYTTEHEFGSNGYEARLRRIQVDRIIGTLNRLEGNTDEEYVLAKKTVIPSEVYVDVLNEGVTAFLSD
ncbi:hypothetical protein B0H14DRAFT_2593611 [Mycena olivaceomarginata]|nr:hypothetical protein B0H14DRAFT_2593611 [Mycena olivaceomarginata]